MKNLNSSKTEAVFIESIFLTELDFYLFDSNYNILRVLKNMHIDKILSVIVYRF